MGASSVTEAFKLYQESKEIFHEGEFNLRKFVSNSKDLLTMINCKEQVMCKSTATEESYALLTLGGSNREIKGIHKVLGVVWDVNTDELVINVEPIVSEALDVKPTKCNSVSLVSKVYDPIGLIAPVIHKI